MATGGSVVCSTTTDNVLVSGRVGSTGTKVAPASGAGKWTISTPASSVYSIVFTEAYAEYLGCSIQLEASGVAYAIFTASTRTLAVSTFAVDGTTATDKAFSFTVVFSENRAP